MQSQSASTSAKMIRKYVFLLLLTSTSPLFFFDIQHKMSACDFKCKKIKSVSVGTGSQLKHVAVSLLIKRK